MRAVFTENGLNHLSRHTYTPGAYTPLDDRLNPFWQFLVDCLPKWLPPNVVTLVGFVPMALAYGLAWWQSPGFAVPASRSLILFTVIALWVYQTTDAMDGKHARRIGAATPVGQLFDHGFDCLATLSFHSMACMVLLPSASRWGLAGQAALMTGFFLAQWSERHMGVLPTSYGAVGVTETQFALMGSLLLGATFGPEVVQTFGSKLVWSPFSADLIPRGIAICQGWGVFCGTIAAMCLFKTAKHVATKKRCEFATAISELIPMALINILFFCWSPEVLATAPRLISLSTGLVMFYFTAQMILYSMAGMPFPTRQLTLLPYSLLVAASWLLPEETEMLRMGILALASGLGVCIGTYLLQAIGEMKGKLGIYVFSLRKSATRRVRTEAGA